MSGLPLFCIGCIDYRFNAFTATYFKNIGNEFNYSFCTVAGGALSLGYQSYCLSNCKPCNPKEKKTCSSCSSSLEPKNNCNCDPFNSTMNLFKQNIINNLLVVLTLQPLEDIFLLNHQDCGAIKGFLECSEYPKILGGNNPKEIKINSILLIYAKKYILKKIPTKKITLGLIDINGSLATLDIGTKTWIVKFVGEFQMKQGLWYGLKIGDTFTI